MSIPRALGGAAAALGLLALAGWTWGVEALKSVVPGLTAMNPLTASCVAAAGACLASPPSSRRLRAALSWSLVAVACLKVLSFAGVDLRLDALLFREALAVYSPQNRMAPNTAACLLLSALALACGGVRGPRAARASQSLALASCAICLFALIGYVYGVPRFYGVGAFLPMALNTALAFACVGAGALLSRREEGWMALVCNDGPGGSMAKGLLPYILAVPAALGFAALAGLRRGWYAPETALALLAAAVVVFFSTLVWRATGLLEEVDGRRRGAESGLRDHARRLEQANEELDAFSYSVSHDLRAPLRAIAGFAQILAEGAQRLDEDGKDALRRVTANCARMGQLIEDLLLLAKISRQELRKIPFDAAAAAREIAARLSADDGGRRVEWVIPPALSVEGDSGLLRVVLENLLGNAWKYSSRRERARIELGETVEGGARVVFVRDDGAGFDMAHADRLFGAFQRLHVQSEFPGTGVGLATVRRIVNRHGGRIWAESAPSRGATFYFTLEETAAAVARK